MPSAAHLEEAEKRVSKRPLVTVLIYPHFLNFSVNFHSFICRYFFIHIPSVYFCEVRSFITCNAIHVGLLFICQNRTLT